MWDVWIEGYQATGEHGHHKFVGSFCAGSFQDACTVAAMKFIPQFLSGGFQKMANIVMPSTTFRESQQW